MVRIAHLIYPGVDRFAPSAELKTPMSSLDETLPFATVAQMKCRLLRKDG